MKQLFVFFLCLTASLADDTDVKQFAASTELFTGALYNELLLDNKDNILVSPFSVETIFALTQSGAVGTTGQEIRKSFFLPDTKEATDSEFKGVLPVIHSDGFTLKTANKVYVKYDFLIKESFKAVATDVYGAAFQNIEFSENVAAAAEINEWVKKETNNKIDEVVSADSLDELTRLVLVNALYFQANFSQPFDPAFTKSSQFFLSEDVVTAADIIFVESAEYNFYESVELDAKFLELPFVGRAASLTIVLPNKKEGIAVLEKQIGAALVAPQYSREFVQVSLPKFRIEATTDFVPILENLGIHYAFNPYEADFSGIAGTPHEVLISKVVQKTYIDVNEGGVEAAAATAIVGPTVVLPEPSQVFNADHPFIFYIKVDDIILFEGRLVAPQ